MFNSIRKRVAFDSLSESEKTAKNNKFFCAAVCAWAAANDQAALLSATAAAFAANDRVLLCKYLFYLGSEPYRVRSEDITQMTVAVAKMPSTNRTMLGMFRFDLGRIAIKYRRAFDISDDNFFTTLYPNLNVVPMATAEQWYAKGAELTEEIARLVFDPAGREKLGITDAEFETKLRQLFPLI